MRIRYGKDIKCGNCNYPIPAEYDNRFNTGLPGFIQYLQYSSCFRSDFLYLDLAIGMER